MARIEGVMLPNGKRIEYGLTYVYGIGLATAQNVLRAVGIDPNIRVHALTDAQVAAIQKWITSHIKVEGELRQTVRDNIKRLQEIGSYRGLRHKRGLPARGQRTKTNARTRKGPRKQGGAIALKRKVTKK